MRKNEKVSPIENWRNIRPVCFAVEIIEIAIKPKKTFRGFFFLS